MPIIKVERETLGLRISKKTKQKIDKIAAEKGFTTSELIRIIIENYLVNK